MKIAIFVKNCALESVPRLVRLRKDLTAAGCELYDIKKKEDLVEGTDLLLSVGGDGTFLSAAKRVAERGVPVLGVNFGRLGFLSENAPEDIVEPLLRGEYSIEHRTMLQVHVAGAENSPEFSPYALNEVSVHRIGSAMLGVRVRIDGEELPTYWADGLLVATSSGSTAYSLSVGGPICTPESRVLIIAPIAPHNLNVRPLVVPNTTRIDISLVSRDGKVMLSMDNRNETVPGDVALSISMAQFSLKRIRLNKSNFVKALTSRLFWGEDARNGREM